jgi:hypothetical protein
VELPPGERFVHPRPEDLPEVRDLVDRGWQVADGSPMWSFLPAVWPQEFRYWVPDRLPRLSRSAAAQRPESTVIMPWTTELAEDMHRSAADLLARVGLPAPP